MENNYYEILEIDKNASQEIIEKAYKTLVKKYHPDLQNNNKNVYEEKIKKINEAYEFLSNPEKRFNYDLNLKNKKVSIEDYNNLYNENIILKRKLNDFNNNIINNNYKNNSETITHTNNYYQDNIKSNNNKNINNSYNITYKKIELNRIFKNFIAIIITILIFILISLILWNIPFTKNYFINLYNNNSALKFIIDLIINIFLIN